MKTNKNMRVKTGGKPVVEREEGFAIVVVLVALLMLSVLGAASLLLMVSSLQGVVNTKPEDRAFQIAESGLYVAHAKIANEEVAGSEYVGDGELLGGDYAIAISPVDGTYDYVVISEGSYIQAGTTYRRKIREVVTFSSVQAFDAMKYYLFYAGNDINIDADETINVAFPIQINGSMRAEGDVNINAAPDISFGNQLTVNGDVEAMGDIEIINDPKFFGWNTINFNGDIMAGDKVAHTGGHLTFRALGTFSLFPFKLSYAVTNAANGVGQKIWCTSNPPVEEIGGFWFFGSWVPMGDINRPVPTYQPGCSEVYLPKPNFAYYKALAEQQGNVVPGGTVLSGNLGDMSMSSMTVIYCEGDLTLRNLEYEDPNMRGTFVCEGDFEAEQGMHFAQDPAFQVIANGDVSFDNVAWEFDWDYITDPGNARFFFWSGNNAYIDLGMFSGQFLQVTAVNDINVFSSDSLFSAPVVNYFAPDVDVSGFPVDMIISEWKELPSE